MYKLILFIRGFKENVNYLINNAMHCWYAGLLKSLWQNFAKSDIHQMELTDYVSMTFSLFESHSVTYQQMDFKDNRKWKSLPFPRFLRLKLAICIHEWFLQQRQAEKSPSCKVSFSAAWLCQSRLSRVYMIHICKFP